MVSRMLFIYDPEKRKSKLLNDDYIQWEFFPTNKDPLEYLCGVEYQGIVFADKFDDDLHNRWVQARVRFNV